MLAVYELLGNSCEQNWLSTLSQNRSTSTRFFIHFFLGKFLKMLIARSGLKLKTRQPTSRNNINRTRVATNAIFHTTKGI